MRKLKKLEVETVRGKRLREVQFSNAGLEGPYGDQPPKKKRSAASNDIGCESSTIQSTQAVNNDDFTSAPLIKIEVQGDSSSSLRFSEKQISGNGPSLRGCTDSGDALSKSNDLQTKTNVEEPVKDKIDKPAKFDVCSRSTIANYGAPTTPTVVRVARPSEVEEKRKDLPIVMMEQEIMEAINENPSVIICGETGCGKTTQVPQFLYEAGFGSNLSTARGGIIGVTQPRRVSVLATARRVAFELGGPVGKEVGFQVRHDKRMDSNCSIKFMTDGILLSELQIDFLLRRYSVIILDEAHERTVNTDILIGMLSRCIRVRQREYEKQQHLSSGNSLSPEVQVYPLKLILMSATLRVEDFVSGKKIFHDPPPVIEVPTRQYPVTIHFSKRTEIVDYVGQAYKKVLSIHKRLPPGGILVFLTGQREVESLCRKLRKASNERSKNVNTERCEVHSAPKDHATEENDMKEISEAFDIQGKSGDDRFSSYDEDQGDLSDEGSDLSYDSEGDNDLDDNDGTSADHKSLEFDQNRPDMSGVNSNLASLKAAFESLDRKKCSNVDSGDQLVPPHALEGKLNDSKSFSGDASVGKSSPAGPLFVLPLYARLPAQKQLRVFNEVKEGARLVVVATNVAETSLTIPGIKYVVDTGREKVKKYNPSNGIEMYEIQWISKASASQRSGRAGRTGPGHCYRLYSSAVFNDIFSDFSPAQISKVPVDRVVLLLKSMNCYKVSNFPFPTPPSASAIDEAESCLKMLAALDDNGKLTPMGKAMAQYPMGPRHSRILLTVIEMMQKIKNYPRANIVLAYAVAAAAAMDSANPFMGHLENGSNDTEELKDEEKSGIKRACQSIPCKEEKPQKKKLKELAKASHAKFSNPTSDVLSIAYALQCFELSGDPKEFCSSNKLHFKIMDEMSKLRKQLLERVFSSNLSGSQQFCWIHGSMDDVECAWKVSSDKHPLQLSDEDILRQAICAGWPDRIARRIKGVTGLSEEYRKVHAVRYQACTVKEPVFLHRCSSLAKSAPEFLVYSELLQTRRLYIRGATSVKAKWLCEYARSSCTFSSPLTDPKPYYDPATDQVFCWKVPTFGPHNWQLPLHSVPSEDDLTRVATFACALLEGQVLPCLKSMREFLSSSPSIIMRPESLGLKRVGSLLYKLGLRRVDSCATLRCLWDKYPKELFPEILEWFQKGFHGQFEKLWIQMQRESRLDPAQRFPNKVKKARGTS